MKSLHIAVAAIVATGTTFASVALIGSADRVMAEGYDRAVAAVTGAPHAAMIAAAHAPGSEHFWLTRPASGDVALDVTLAGATALDLSDIKQAIATAGAFEPAGIEIVSVGDIARIAGDGRAAGKSLLVTARVAATARQPARLVRFVVDADAGPARAL